MPDMREDVLLQYRGLSKLFRKILAVSRSHLPPGQTSKLVVEPRHQTIQRLLIPAVSCQQECREIGRPILLHGDSHNKNLGCGGPILSEMLRIWNSLCLHKI